jgi:hypothetical protein
MTSYYYAVADAGGNIYPGTFAKDRLGAQCLHVAGGRRDYSLLITQVDGEWVLREDNFAPFAAQGDHVVHCKIETNETVKITYEHTD